MTMNDGRFAHAFLRMRTPLARAELAASRLARDAATPAARGLAAGISEAVREVDQEIVRSLQSLRPVDAAEDSFGDCADVLPALRTRMAPVLCAHDIAWTQAAKATREANELPVLGDRVGLARAAVVMLRAGIDFVGPGGCFVLETCRNAEVDALGLRLEATRPTGTRRDPAGGDPLSPALSFALHSGGCLEVQHRSHHATATLWLGGSAAARAAAPADGEAR